MNYQEFLQSKIKVAVRHGINVNPDELHPSLRPDQRDITAWALGLGAALVALDAGCGKTRIGIETIYRYKPAGANRYNENSHHPMLRSGVDDKFLENCF